MKKENYIEKVNKIFKNDKKVKDIFIKQIDLFLKLIKIIKSHNRNINWEIL